MSLRMFQSQEDIVIWIILIRMAKREKAKGFKIISLNFHYSDWWADLFRQAKQTKSMGEMTFD